MASKCAFCGGTEGDFVEDDSGKWIGIQKELKRSGKLRCPECGKGKAAIGCSVPSCKRSYHYGCACAAGCSFNKETYTILCPDHLDQEHPKRGSLLMQKKKVADVPYDSEATYEGSDDDQQPLIELQRRADGTPLNVQVCHARHNGLTTTSPGGGPGGEENTSPLVNLGNVKTDRGMGGEPNDEGGDELYRANSSQDASSGEGEDFNTQYDDGKLEKLRNARRRALKSGEAVKHVRKNDARFMVNDDEIRYSDWTQESEEEEDLDGRKKRKRRNAAVQAETRTGAMLNAEKLTRKPEDWIGTAFRKAFADRTYNGIIDGYNTRTGLLHAVFSDEDEEDLTIAALESMLDEHPRHHGNEENSDCVKVGASKCVGSAPLPSPLKRGEKKDSASLGEGKDEALEDTKEVAVNARNEGSRRRAKLKLESDDSESDSEKREPAPVSDVDTVDGDVYKNDVLISNIPNEVDGIHAQNRIGSNDNVDNTSKPSTDVENQPVPIAIDIETNMRTSRSPDKKSSPNLKDRRSKSMDEKPVSPVAGEDVQILTDSDSGDISEDDAKRHGSQDFVRPDHDDISASDWTDGWDEAAERRGKRVHSLEPDGVETSERRMLKAADVISDCSDDYYENDIDAGDQEELEIVATDGDSDADEALVQERRQAQLEGKRHLGKQDKRFMVSDDEIRYSDWTEEDSDQAEARQRKKKTAAELVAEAMARPEVIDIEASDDNNGNSDGYFVAGDMDESGRHTESRRGGSKRPRPRKKTARPKHNEYKSNHHITDYPSMTQEGEEDGDIDRKRSKKQKRRHSGAQNAKSASAAKKMRRGPKIHVEAWWSYSVQGEPGALHQSKMKKYMYNVAGAKPTEDVETATGVKATTIPKSSLPWPIDISVPLCGAEAPESVRAVAERAADTLRVSRSNLPLSATAIESGDYNILLFKCSLNIMCLEDEMERLVPNFCACLRAIGVDSVDPSQQNETSCNSPFTAEQALTEIEKFFSLMTAILDYISGTLNDTALHICDKSLLPSLQAVLKALANLLSLVEIDYGGIAVSPKGAQYHWHKLKVFRGHGIFDPSLTVSECRPYNMLLADSKSNEMSRVEVFWSKQYLCFVLSALVDGIEEKAALGSVTRPPSMWTMALWSQLIIALDVLTTERGHCWKLLTELLCERRKRKLIGVEDIDDVPLWNKRDQVLAEHCEFEWEVVLFLSKLYPQAYVIASGQQNALCSIAKATNAIKESSRRGSWGHIAGMLVELPLSKLLAHDSELCVAFLRRCASLSKYWNPDAEIPAILFKQLQQFIAMHPRVSTIDCYCCSKVKSSIFDRGQFENSWWRSIGLNAGGEDPTTKRNCIYMSSGSVCYLVFKIIDLHLSRLATDTLSVDDLVAKHALTNIRRSVAKLYREVPPVQNIDKMFAIGDSSENVSQPHIIRCRAIFLRHLLQLLVVLRRRLPSDQHGILLKRLNGLTEMSNCSEGDICHTMILEGLLFFLGSSFESPSTKGATVKDVENEIQRFIIKRLSAVEGNDMIKKDKATVGFISLALRCTRVLLITGHASALDMLPSLGLVLRRSRMVPAVILRSTVYVTFAAIVQLMQVGSGSLANTDESQTSAVDKYVFHPIMGMMKSLTTENILPLSSKNSSPLHASCPALGPLCAAVWSVQLTNETKSFGDIVLTMPFFFCGGERLGTAAGSFWPHLIALGDGNALFTSGGPGAIIAWCAMMMRMSKKVALPLLEAITNHGSKIIWSHVLSSMRQVLESLSRGPEDAELGGNGPGRESSLAYRSPSWPRDFDHRQKELSYSSAILRIGECVVEQHSKSANRNDQSKLSSGMGQILALCAHESTAVDVTIEIMRGFTPICLQVLKTEQNPNSQAEILVQCMVGMVDITRRALSLGLNEKGLAPSNSLLCGVFEFLSRILLEDLPLGNCPHVLPSDPNRLASMYQGTTQQQVITPSSNALIRRQIRTAIDAISITAMRSFCQTVTSMRPSGTAAFAAVNRRSQLPTLKENLAASLQSQMRQALSGQVAGGRQAVGGKGRVKELALLEMSIENLHRLGVSMLKPRRLLSRDALKDHGGSSHLPFDAFVSQQNLIGASMLLMESLAVSGGGNAASLHSHKATIVMALQVAEADGGRESDKRLLGDLIKTPITRILQALTMPRTLSVRRNITGNLNP